MTEQYDYGKRADELADTMRRFLIGINTGGIAASLTFAANLSQKGLDPAWIALPVGLFLLGLGITGVSLLYAKHKALKRKDAMTEGREIPKHTWYRGNLIFEVITLAIFLTAAGTALYQLQHLNLKLEHDGQQWPVTAAATGPHITCQVTVPKEYQKTPWSPPPNGEPEPVRYQKSYEAFWWNCIMVKANKLDSRCPFTCSGTPAAVAGCGDGESDAERQINNLLNKYSRPEVEQYLHSLAATEEAKKKIYPYFQEKPQPEKVQ